MTWGIIRTLFGDVSELLKPRALNIVSGRQECIQYFKVFVGGFVCVDKSHFQTRRAEELPANALEKGLGKTGLSWRLVETIVSAISPEWAVLENLPSLLVPAKGQEQADIEHIENFFKSRSYAFIAFVDQATDHGSRARRERCIMVATPFLHDGQM